MCIFFILEAVGEWMRSVKKVVAERLLSVAIVGGVCAVYLGKTVETVECAGIIIVLSSISQQYFDSFWRKYCTRAN